MARSNAAWNQDPTIEGSDAWYLAHTESVEIENPDYGDDDAPETYWGGHALSWVRDPEGIRGLFEAVADFYDMDVDEADEGCNTRQCQPAVLSDGRRAVFHYDFNELEVGFCLGGVIFRLVVPAAGLDADELGPWGVVERFDEINGTDAWEHLETDNLLDTEGISGIRTVRDRKDWVAILYDARVLPQVVATKKISASGNSLVVPITSEAQALGLERGDYVRVTLERIE